MNLKEFLYKNKIIQKSALAELMWPDKKNQAKVFSNKITEKATSKTGSKQRITESDEVRAKIVLLEVAEKIKLYAGDYKIIAPEASKQPEKPVKKETPIINKPKVPTKKVVEKAEKEPTMAELLRQMNRK